MLIQIASSTNYLSLCEQLYCMILHLHEYFYIVSNHQRWQTSCCIVSMWIVLQRMSFFMFFKSPESANFLSQCEQLNGSSPAWVTCSCCVRLVGLTKKILIGDHCQLLEITDTKDYLTTKHAHCSPNHK